MSHVVKLRNIKRALTLKPNSQTSYILSGRISNFRPYKSFNFIDLVDGSSKDHIQVVAPKETLKKPDLGSYITCQGSIVESRGVKQAVEFRVDNVHYVGECDPKKYPLATSLNLSYDWYRKLPHMRPRAPHFASLLRVKSELELSLHMIMKQMDFFKVHTSSLSSNDSEASSDLFLVNRTKLVDKEENVPIDEHDEGYQSEYSSESECEDRKARLIKDSYFKKDVFLITSAQLHLENLAASLSRVYTLSNAFRAENSISTRHLCEFIMLEAEEANVVDIEPLMNRVESIMKFIAQFLSEVSEHKKDFNSLVEDNENLDNFNKLAYSAYIRMDYLEALEILKKDSSLDGKVSFGMDIKRMHERKLLDYSNNVPMFITNYPRKLKPFYMKCNSEDDRALCFDLIVPSGGEVCGGSLREDSYEKLIANLKVVKGGGEDKKVKEVEEHLKYFDWYLDSRRFGSFPHGGFGIGIERLLQALLGLKNIKDTTAFPRWTGHCPM